MHNEGVSFNHLLQSNSVNRNESVINLPFGHLSTLSNDRGTPPSYEETIEPNASPPSYDSLFGRIREQHKNSKGVIDFLKNIIILFIVTIRCTICLGILFALPVCMVVIGGLYLNDCPQGEYIPIYLLVAGCFGIFRQLLKLCECQRQEEGDIIIRPIKLLVNVFITGWFILGSIWVYREYEPNYDPALGKYCNRTLYLFSFWVITLAYISFGVGILVTSIVFLINIVQSV